MDLDSRVNMTRLFVDYALMEHALIELNSAQSHYLFSVLRKKNGAELLLFNGRDGGFLGVIETTGRRSLAVRCKQQLLLQTSSPDLWLIFVPIKRTRMDFMVQKATELGVSKIWPVQSEFCQVKQIREDKLRSNIIEAAEQTERLDLPEIGKFTQLKTVLDNWPNERVLIVCDETKSEEEHALSILQLNRKLTGKAAILIGPEGGFSALERDQLHKHPMCENISLGPRILRSDTAALAALSIFQANFGDWYKKPAYLNDEEKN